jgi:hypothetical protein
MVSFVNSWLVLLAQRQIMSKLKSKQKRLKQVEKKELL